MCIWECIPKIHCVAESSFRQTKWIMSLFRSTNRFKRNEINSETKKSGSGRTGLVWGDSVYCILVHYLRQHRSISLADEWWWQAHCNHIMKVHTSRSAFARNRNRRNVSKRQSRSHSHLSMSCASIVTSIQNEKKTGSIFFRSRESRNWTRTKWKANTSNWEREIVELCVVN